MKHSKNIHDDIISNILSFDVVFRNCTSDEFFVLYKDCDIDYSKKEIGIRICNEELNWIKEGKRNFASTSYVDIESIINGFGLKGKNIDAYGSVIIDDTLILNDYDGSFYESDKDPKGFCNIIGFATVTNSGIVRFSQIVYSFRFKKLIVRDDVTYHLPFKPNLEVDFGGKRATYRHGCILSLRTTLDVYKKVEDSFKQSDSYKDSLSYPRLILR